MKKSVLEHIKHPQDVKKLTTNDLPILAKELRDFIIAIVSVKEGHLGASLGVVELTIALHYVFNTPSDLLVWDVGHQAYPHKILTGRKDSFHTNRQLNGISGFPKRSESEFDTFGVGHSSTSISAALGMAIASNLKGEINKHHIAVIGDASIASGMAFEGLNHAGVTNANLLVILNDNEMGIDPNVGALKEYLTQIKKEDSSCEGNLFTNLNFAYSGPIDGHDLVALTNELNRLKDIKGPKFLHIITTKGKGLKQAEQDQVTYHAPGKFDKISGEITPKNTTHLAPKFQDVFGHTLVELAKGNEKIIGITPAMPTGSSLKYMLEEIPERAFDVGIAEQHAVTFSAGLATQGLVPFCAIYSTFLQRAYDQIIHDVALQNLPVIFCIDRAGLVGEDGATHHGVFDLAYLRLIPNLIITAPLNYEELRNLMFTAQNGLKNPIAIRYPRGRMQTENTDWKTPFKTVEIGKAKSLNKGTKIAIITTGIIGNTIIDICQDKKYNDIVSHYHFTFIKPLDVELLHTVCTKFNDIICLENGTISGGFSSAIAEFIIDHNYTKINLKRLGIPDNFITHGKLEELHQQISLDKKSILKEIDKLV